MRHDAPAGGQQIPSVTLSEAMEMEL
jgi:hypothetical protein